MGRITITIQHTDIIGSTAPISVSMMTSKTTTPRVFTRGLLDRSKIGVTTQFVPSKKASVCRYKLSDPISENSFKRRKSNPISTISRQASVLKKWEPPGSNFASCSATEIQTALFFIWKFALDTNPKGRGDFATFWSLSMWTPTRAYCKNVFV